MPDQKLKFDVKSESSIISKALVHFRKKVRPSSTIIDSESDSLDL